MDDDRMSREEIIEKFSELEDKYKIECSPEGIQNILGIYDITPVSYTHLTLPTILRV